MFYSLNISKHAQDKKLNFYLAIHIHNVTKVNTMFYSHCISLSIKFMIFPYPSCGLSRISLCKLCQLLRVYRLNTE